MATREQSPPGAGPALVRSGRIEAAGDATWSDTAALVYRDAEAALSWPTSAGRIAAPAVRLATEGVSPAISINELERHRDELPALAAVEDIRVWLDVSYDEVAKIAGWSSPSIIFYWRSRAKAAFADGERRPPRPRPQTVLRLYQVHGLLRALGRAVGGEGSQVRAVQTWVRAGEAGTRPIDLLLDGRLEAVAATASDLLFSREPPTNAFSTPRYADDEDSQDQRSPVRYSGSFEPDGEDDGFE